MRNLRLCGLWKNTYREVEERRLGKLTFLYVTSLKSVEAMLAGHSRLIE